MKNFSIQITSKPNRIRTLILLGFFLIGFGLTNVFSQEAFGNPVNGSATMTCQFHDQCANLEEKDWSQDFAFSDGVPSV